MTKKRIRTEEMKHYQTLRTKHRLITHYNHLSGERTAMKKTQLNRLNQIIFDFMNSLTNRERYDIVTGKMKNEMRMFVGGLKKITSPHYSLQEK